MNLKDLTELNNKLEIEKIEVKDNDFYVFYKNGKKKKLGRIFVTSVVSAGGETPVGDYATKEWVLGKGYAQQSWVSEGFLPKGSLDDYATKEWVGEQGYLTETDLDGFATETWVKDQKYLVSSDLQGYATESWVSEQNYLTENDLNGYATEQWVEGKGYITSSALDGYATEQWVENKGYIDDTYHDSTKADAIHTHTTSEITDFPTNVSAFTNDAGYLTEHQSLDNYYTKSETDTALNGKADRVHTHTVSNITDFPTDVSSFNNDVGYITNEKFFYVPITTTPSTTVKWDELYQAYDDDKVIIAQIDYTQSGITIPLNATLYGVLGNASAGTMMFTFLMGTHSISYTVTGTGSNTCTVTIQEQELELLSNKVQSVVSNNTSTTKYASTKAVFDEFQRKPVVVWQETTPANYLAGINADISASPAWQLTNLDLTPYKRIKIYSCAGRKSSGVGVDASTTPAIVLEMSLDTRNAIADYGGNYISSVVVQKPNDANRLATLTCAVSADKTSFVVLRQTSLYGTGATSNNDVNANVFMIEGYYD